jgi:hypothetical protein
MKYIKLYEDWHIMPDGSMREVVCSAEDLIFNMFNWLDKLIEIEPSYINLITQFKKDLDRGYIDPHNLIDSNKVFFTEEDVSEYLLDIVLNYKKRS